MRDGAGFWGAAALDGGEGEGINGDGVLAGGLVQVFGEGLPEDLVVG